MERYEKYKDSGIEWIGEIPEHWDIKKLKYIAIANPSNIDKRSKDNEKSILLCNYIDVYKNEFISSKLDFMKATANEDQIRKFILEKGDVIATKDSETPDDIAIPTLVIENLDNVVCGYHLTHIKTTNIDGKYLFRYFQTKYLKSYFEVSANGVTRYGLGVDKFNSALILNPSKSEQTIIIEYLDRKTSEIDQLIAQKEYLIELYEEEKIVIINQAVTKGINPDVKLKDSGIEWLRLIPKHWEVKKLKTFISKAGSGVTPRGGASVYQLSGIPLLRSQNVYFDGLKLDDVAYITQETHDKMLNSQVFTGDVLLNITGASIGRCYYVTDSLGEANVNQHVCILRPKKIILTKFLYFILRSNLGQEQINVEQTGSGREGLNFEVLKNFLIPSIDINEQLEIISHIETQITHINSQIARTKKIISLQKEYRKALISEVVTGKIKVTNGVQS